MKTSGRVLLLSDCAPPEGGSRSLRVAAWMDEVCMRGDSSMLVTTLASQAVEEEPYLAKRMEANILRTPLIDVATSSPRGVPGRLYASINGWFCNLRLQSRLQREHNREAFNLVLTLARHRRIHQLGFMLSRHFQTPWIADVHEDVHGEHEVAMFTRATELCFMQSVPAKRWNAFHGDNKRGHFALSKDHLESLGAFSEQQTLSDSVRLVHVGRTCQNPSLIRFLQALSRCLHQGVVSPGRTRVDLIGIYSPDSRLKDMIERLHLQRVVRFGGYIPHTELLQILRGANGLILTQASTGTSCDDEIPERYYDYLRAERPVFACVESAALQKVITEHGHPVVLPTKSMDDMERVLAEALCNLTTIQKRVTLGASFLEVQGTSASFSKIIDYAMNTRQTAKECVIHAKY